MIILFDTSTELIRPRHSNNSLYYLYFSIDFKRTQTTHLHAMQISIVAILGLGATSAFALPAPEAEGGVLEARATPYLRFYNKINFKQPLCNFEFTQSADQALSKHAID